MPDHILLKPGKLTKEEFEIMKTHITIGYETLFEVHEKYKNNGPCGCIRYFVVKTCL